MKGDEVLKKTGQILLKTIREVDTACRYGGDEFVLILPKCDLENAKRICEKIIDAFAQKYPSYTLSMGIAETGTNNHYIDGDQLIKNADINMYKAKQKSGFQIRY